MYDEFPNCITSGCPNESSHDSGLCFTCRSGMGPQPTPTDSRIFKGTMREFFDREIRPEDRNFDLAITDGDPKFHDLQSERRAMLAGFVGRGPDEDGEKFVPMTDDEMAFAQARYEFELSTPHGAVVPF